MAYELLACPNSVADLQTDSSMCLKFLTSHLHDVNSLSDTVLVLQQVPMPAQAREHFLGIRHSQLQPVQALLPGLPSALRRGLPQDQLLLQVLSLGAAIAACSCQ